MATATVASVDLRDEQPTQHEIGNRTFLVADVDPLDVDGVRTVSVGSGMFLLGFLALLPFYGSLEENGRTWWLWIFGVEYCRRRRVARDRMREDGE